MKIYRCTKDYFDGDHDHGQYESPLFSTRELAEQFKQAICEQRKDNPDNMVWLTDCEYFDLLSGEDIYISEIEIQEVFDLSMVDRKKNLSITYT